MRYALASIALASLITLAPQQGMIPVVDTKPASTAPVFNPCLISGWPANEGSGRQLFDVSGNSNTATTGTVTPTWGSNAGFPGSSLTFNPTGANNAGSASTTLTNFDGTTPFSLAVWASITSSAANEVIFSDIGNAGVYIGWEMTTETLPTNKLEFQLANNAASNRIYVHGSTTIVSTGIHYLVATYDGTKLASGVKLYVDGAAETVTVDQNNLTLTTASGRVAGLGNRPADGAGFSGVAQAFAIYNCVLTPTNVSTYFARGVQVN